MIEVESYLKKRDSFIPIDSYHGGVKDSHYIEGAIRLNVNGVEVIDFTMWDYVDALWEFILNVIEQVDKAGEGEISWPDQPIVLRVRRIRGSEDVVVEVDCHGQVRGRTSYREFKRGILNGAHRFFDCMCRIVPVNRVSYQQVLQRIAKLRGAEN